MTRRYARPIGLGLALIALVAVGALLLSNGSGQEASPGQEPVHSGDPAAQSAGGGEQGRGGTGEGELAFTSTPEHTLTLPDGDSPFVWVRDGRKIDIHSTPGGPVVKTVGPQTEFGSQRTFSVVLTEGGKWAGVPTPFTGNDDLGWIRLDRRDLRAGSTAQEIVVDLSDRRAELLRDGKMVRAFTVSVGAPATTTPTGRFAVTDTFRGGLHPAYGCCAVALTAVQPNLPSGWFGGDRIALHGTSGPLGEAISSGCVRAADRDVSALVDAVPPGAPVTINE